MSFHSQINSLKGVRCIMEIIAIIILLTIVGWVFQHLGVIVAIILAITGILIIAGIAISIKEDKDKKKAEEQRQIKEKEKKRKAQLDELLNTKQKTWEELEDKYKD